MPRTETPFMSTTGRPMLFGNVHASIELELKCKIFILRRANHDISSTMVTRKYKLHTLL